MTPSGYTPPPLHFMIIEFSSLCGWGQFTFYCKTDTPCHLWLHLSRLEPIVRRVPYIKRGVDFELSSVTCFVEIKAYEQQESADSIHHHFIISPIDYDVMYYWYLTGTQGGAPCKSISQIFSHQCAEQILPATQVYEKSNFRDYVASLNFRRNSCYANIGYGAGSDFVALSDHPLNRIKVRLRQYMAMYPRCGAEFRLYEADASCNPTGAILTSGQVPRGEIPVFPGVLIKDLNLPLANVTGGKRYIWVCFSIEEMGPTWVSMWARGQARNYAATNFDRKWCKANLALYGSAYPSHAYFENWIINPPP